MTLHQLTTGHVRAVVRLPEHLDTAAARAAARFLPGGWHLGEPGASEGLAAVEIAIGTADVTADADTVRIRLPHDSAVSASLAYLTYTALERVRQRRGKVTVHATALVPPDGRAVLLLGDKGAGKTTTALALAERGWVHAGDDLVVLAEEDGGQVAVWPGKPTAAVREPHAPLAPKHVLDLAPFAASPAPLGWVVRLAVHPGRTSALRPAVPLSVNEGLRLHELLTRYLSGLPTPLAGVGAVPYGPVWPLDAPALARWRSHLISRLAAGRFDYLYAPDAHAAAELLAKEAAG
ncbi:hypothetical protein [Kitasatospora sp. NPDC059817]|uniref:hypothetical protein n=1 Tax=Kitasatospora sp. NPDC059817 TaxID=3346961 RepID=UPI0036651330